MAEKNRLQHNELQVEYFDQRAELFQKPIPGEVQERTAYIVKTASVGSDSKILDVGTGAGVLIGHFLAAGAQQKNVIGCDLTQAMLKIAATRFTDVFFWLGDIMDFDLAGLTKPSNNSAGTVHSTPTPKHISGFDLIFFNACLANMHDQRAVLSHCRNLLLPGGKVVISHPAPEFVSWVRESDPDIVPHTLPSKDEASKYAHDLKFTLRHFESSDLLYIAILERSE